MARSNLKNLSLKLILSSKSPRRQYILKEAGFDFTTRVREVEEIYPDDMDVWKVASYLSELKASAHKDLADDEVLLTSDTVVILDDTLLGKPVNEEDAMQMLRNMSGKHHTVVTAVCLKTSKGSFTFDDRADVYFRPLSEEFIRDYVATGEPMDKAGSYGVQDRFGMLGIDRINGSYFTIMGLPVHKVYEHLSYLANNGRLPQ
ncbi:nucleoside triphosphate pyrophosphatase [Roseivirga sp. BDSF3-8]|uniref:Maf family protein n=1 Tax=Roseivirga sp. BDSF3-8 TaxID=3241598 RepID=UPI0035320168